MNSEKIGGVLLNYNFYQGTDSYSDGDVEERLLEIAKGGNARETLLEENDWTLLYHFSDIRENLLEWYPFEKEQSLLEIGSGCGALTGLFCRKCGRVVANDLSRRRSLVNAYRNQAQTNLEILVGNFESVRLEEKFDYVTLIGVLEYSIYYLNNDDPFADMLKRAKGYLKPGGKLMVAIENKYGLKYWAGAREDHTGGLADGLEGYVRENRVRTFSKAGLETLLRRAGFEKLEFYYPVPDYKLPMEIYSEKRLPGSYALPDVAAAYDRDRYIYFNEQLVMSELIREGQFEMFANSFLVICQ